MLVMFYNLLKDSRGRGERKDLFSTKQVLLEGSEIGKLA